MGWENAHLHAFRVSHDTYGEPDPGYPDDMQNEDKIRLDKIVSEDSTFIYEYDFGDGWQHELKIEKVLPAEAEVDYPRCLDGQRACPPEDCGGPPGYAQMLEVLNDPNDEEHKEIMEWLGEDVDAVNRYLRPGV